MAKAKRKAGKKNAGRAGMDITVLLKQDHAKVKKAVKDFEKLHEKDMSAAGQIAAAAVADLKVHAQLEEELFYPALRKAGGDEMLLNEAQVEHSSAKTLIRELEAMRPGDPLYAATFMVLGEYVLHHVKEEEGEIFKEAKKKKLDLRALGEEMMARKAALAGAK